MTKTGNNAHVVIPLMAALLGAGSCSSGVDGNGALGDRIEREEKALRTFVTSWKDSSNKITVSLYTCDHLGPPSQHPISSCSVPEEEAVVGGGATTDVEGTDPGVLLVASYPSDNKRTWNAESKDHAGYYNPHRLQVSVLGLRLEGLTGQQLRDQMEIYQGCGDLNIPVAPRTGWIEPYVLGPDGDQVIVGGGGRAIYTGEGRLLADSMPIGPTYPQGWASDGTDHISSDVGNHCVYKISIPAIPAGFTGGRIFASLVQADGTSVSTGYASEHFLVLPWTPGVNSGALSSIGCAASWGGGRLLSRCDVSVVSGHPMVTASTKDHGYVASGYVSAYAVTLNVLTGPIP